MAFILESPATQETIDKYNWESIPLLYEGGGQKFCKKIEYAYVDKERDWIFFVDGGRRGFDEQMTRFTYILLFKGILVRFFYKTIEAERYKDVNTNLYVFTYRKIEIETISVSEKFRNREKEILANLKMVISEITNYDLKTKIKVDVIISNDIEYK